MMAAWIDPKVFVGALLAAFVAVGAMVVVMSDAPPMGVEPGLPAAEAESPPPTFEECVRRAVDSYEERDDNIIVYAVRGGFVMQAEIAVCERQFPEDVP